MAIEERINLPADSGDLEQAADAAEALASALSDVEDNAIKASKATDSVKVSKGGAAKESAAHPFPPAPGGPENPTIETSKAPTPKEREKKKKQDAKDAAKAAKEEKKASDQVAKDEAKNAAKTAKIHAKGEKEIANAAKKAEADKAKAAAASEKKRAAAFGVAKGIGAAVAAAATLAVAGLAGIAGGLKTIGENKIARDNIKQMLNQLTRGRGEEAFKKLDTLARKLGATTEDVATDFYKLRKQGLSNVDAASVIKLKNDLLAVGVQAEDVDTQIGNVVGQIKRGGNAGAIIAATAKKFGAVGDGSNAAAKSVGTVEGAFNSLKRAFDDVLGKLGDEFGPIIVDLVKEVQTAFGSIDPNTAKEAIGHIKNALLALKPVIRAAAATFKFLLDVFNSVATLIEGKGPLFEALKEIWTSIKTTVTDMAQAISNAFSTAYAAVESAINSVIEVVKSFVGAIGDAWTAVTTTVSDIGTAITDAFKAAYDAVTGVLKDIADAVSGFVDDAIQLGKDIVHALTLGLLDDEEVKTAGADMGKKAIEGIRSQQGVDAHSPSRKAVKIGKDVVEGTKIGLDTAPADMIPKALMLDRIGGPSRPPANDVESPRAGDIIVSLSITINGDRAKDEILEDIEERVESAVRRAVGS